MNWFVPTPEVIRTLRLKDGPNYSIPQEYIQNLLVDESGNICFPVYALDGTQVGWNHRTAQQKKWSQSIQYDAAPRYTSWTPHVADLIYTNRKICICEGPFDALALAPVIPWVIAANTARVQKEILHWCKAWHLHVFLALDKDAPDPRTHRSTGQEATNRIALDLESRYCKVTKLSWEGDTTMPGTALRTGVHVKDPSQAFALYGVVFQNSIASQVYQASQTHIAATQ